MSRLLKLILFDDASIMRQYFVKDRSGRTLYVPGHVANPVHRRAFALQDEGDIPAMVRATRAFGIALMVVASIVLVAVFVQIENIKRTLPAWFVVGAAVAYVALIMLAIGGFERYMQGRFRLEADHRRSMEEVIPEIALTLGFYRSTMMVWLVVIAMAGLALYLAWRGTSSLLAGDLVFGGSALLAALLVSPLAALGPALIKVRALQRERTRLEALVAERTVELQRLADTLEARVRDQVQHIERLGQLKHFFAAPVAELILNEKGFDPARVHRREITVVSLDLRGFTRFSETSEPEEIISVLRTYHAELGILVSRYRATLEHFAGDGVMLFLNDPVEIPGHPQQGLELAVAMREAMAPHLERWRGNGFDLGLGIGIATGYATIGAVGYEGRWEYSAIGNVCNLAARLCSEARDMQIVVSQRFLSQDGVHADVEPLGDRALKGLSRPVAAFNVLGVKTAGGVVRV